MRALCPRCFYFVESLPRGITGKVKRGNVSKENAYYQVL